MQNQFDETKNNEQGSDNQSFAYQNVMTEKKIRRTWSVVSLAFSILSIAFFWLSWLGLAFGAISVAFALLSRKELTYFDSMSLASIIIGVFGIVFAIVGLIFGNLLSGLFLPL